LRDRPDDIALLARVFAERAAVRMGRRIEPLSPAAAEALTRYSWPGNVRELRNVMERAVISARDGRLDLAHLLQDSSTSPTPGPEVGDRVRTDAEMRELERANIVRALQAADWQIAGEHAAAELLQLSPSTLASRMKALGIARPPRR